MDRPGGLSAARGWDVAASLLLLFGLAIAQPLLDLVARHAQFLVAHDATRAQIVALALGLTIGIPLLLAAAVQLVGLVAPRARSVTWGASIALLAGMLFLRMAISIAPSGPGPVLIGASLAAGFGCAVAYARSGHLRWTVRLGAPVGLVVAGFFLFASPVSRMLFPPEPAGASETGRAGDVPVVMIVFDELPVVSLMTDQAEIDATAFPNFARLAASSTWFRNATTVDDMTIRALPALLTGRYPTTKKLPIVGDYPENLFTMVGPTHRVTAIEPLTGLCPFTYCERDGAGAGALLSDLAILTLHILAPEDLATHLPSLEDAWAGFGDADPPAAGVAGRPAPPDVVGDLDRAGHIAQLVAAIEPSPKGSFYFLHLVSPHVPWDHLADGTRYVQSDVIGRGEFWEDDDWVARRGYQRHLMQVGFTDLLLGRVLERLERAGIYDDALIVATADHGTGFQPGLGGRKIGAGNVGSIAFVPLFVKEPGQRSGEIVDSPVETIDIVPTVLDVLGLETPSGVDGISLFGTDLSTERVRRLPFTSDIEIGPDDSPMRAVLEHKQRLMGPYLDDLFALAPPGLMHLLDRPVDALPIGPALDAGAELVDASGYQTYRMDEGACRCLVEGAVSGDVEPGTALAVVVNGNVAGVTHVSRGMRFEALVPPAGFRAGRNDVDVYAISATGDAARLHRLRR